MSSDKKKVKFLEMFDLFGQRGFVYVKNSEMLRTATSGCLSITLVVLMVAAFGYYLATMLSRNVVTVSTSTIVDPDVSLQLDSTNFMFAVGFNRSTNDMLNGSLDFQLELSDYNRLDNGTQIKQTNTTYMIPCPPSFFSSIGGVNFTKQYNDYDMGSLFCPNISNPSSNNLSLSGNFLGKEFRFLKVSVYPCSNATHETFGLPPCAPQEQITNILESIGRMRFQVYFPTYIVNLYDYQNPYMGNISNQEWLLSPSGIQIFSNMYLTKQAILTDDNLLYSRGNASKIVWTVPLSNFRDEIYEYGTNELINLTLRMDINGITYYRNYMKVPDLLSKTGGLFPLLFAAFGWLAIRYNQYKIKNFVANEIYTVEKEKRDDSSSRSSFSDHHDIEMGGNPDNSMVEEKKLESFNRNFSKFLDKDKMKSSCWRFTETFLCFWAPWTKRKLYQYFTAEKKLREDLDIISIVKRINQLEKFKELMFTKEQIELFDYTPEPKLFAAQEDEIYNRDNRESVTLLKKREDYHSIPSLMKMYMAYKKLQNDTDPERAKENKQIINMLGSDMLRTLDRLDYEIERDPQLIPHLVRIFPEITEGEIEDARRKTTIERIAEHAKPTTFNGLSMHEPLMHKEKMY